MEEKAAKTREAERLEEARENKGLWKKWGPYLSERQWGTVREDYSNDGNAVMFHMVNDDIIFMPDKWGYPGTHPPTPSRRGRGRAAVTRC